KGFESTKGFELVQDKYTDGSGSPSSGQIVFAADNGVEGPAVRTAMEDLFARVRNMKDVTSVQSPYDLGGEFQIASQGDQAGKIAFATVNMPEDIDFTSAANIAEEIRDNFPKIEGLQVEAGGYMFAEFEPP